MAFTFPTDSNNKAGAVRENPGGTGFHNPVILYDTDGVTPLGLNIGKASSTRDRAETLASQAEYVVMDVSVPFVIEQLEWATNNSAGNIIIEYPRDGGYAPIGTLRTDGSSTTGFSPAAINQHGSSLFDIIAYNTQANEYKFGLNRSLSFPKGLRIKLRNNTSGTINIACRVYGRELA